MTPTDINRAASAIYANPEAHHSLPAPSPLQALRGGDSFWGAALVFISVGAVIGSLVLAL